MNRITPLLAASLLSLIPGRALAIPAFARQTGMSCTACHDAWPRLNDFGERFRDRGYRTNEDADKGVWHALESVPISFRTGVVYQYTATTHQATDTGDVTVQTGTVPFPSGDLYVAAALSNHVSVFSDMSGYSGDGSVSFESAWARLNDLGTSWLNFKLGKQELDLPVSEHRSLTIFTPFLIYAYHPAGSANGFTLDENQLGVELMGHGDGVGFRYSLALSTNGDSPSGNWVSTPTAYGHVTYTLLPRSEVVSRLRFGAMGDVGYWPTSFAFLTPPGGTPAIVPGTGGDLRPHGRAGLDAQVEFGPLSTPLVLSAVWMYGEEDGALVANGSRVAQFHGGFVQLDYTPCLRLTFGVRFDGVYNLQQADPTQPDNSNQEVGYTGFLRYALWMAPWGALALHLEGGTMDTQNAAAVPTNPVRSTFAIAGFDVVL